MRGFRRRASKDEPLTVDGGEIVADAEAFLAGGYCDQLRRRGEAVPGWVQLNLFAHGDVTAIRRQRRNAAKTVDPSADRADLMWRGAQHVLAGEIIDLVHDDPELLSYVQRRALVPLEFRLMQAGSVTAYELVKLTRDALRSSIS